MSVTRLIEIAHHYHPQMAGLTFQTADALADYEQATPQWRARVAAHERGLADRQRWTDFIQAMTERLPGHLAHDGTRWMLPDPAYIAIFGVTATPDYPQHRVVVMVSMIAPVYYAYEVLDAPRRYRHEFSDSAAAVVAMAEAEIAARFGYQRLASNHGAIRLPKLQVGSLPDGRTTLADALMTDSRW